MADVDYRKIAYIENRGSYMDKYGDDVVIGRISEGVDNLSYAKRQICWRQLKYVGGNTPEPGYLITMRSRIGGIPSLYYCKLAGGFSKVDHDPKWDEDIRKIHSFGSYGLVADTRIV